MNAKFFEPNTDQVGEKDVQYRHVGKKNSTKAGRVVGLLKPRQGISHSGVLRASDSKYVLDLSAMAEIIDLLISGAGNIETKGISNYSDLLNYGLNDDLISEYTERIKKLGSKADLKIQYSYNPKAALEDIMKRENVPDFAREKIADIFWSEVYKAKRFPKWLDRKKYNDLGRLTAPEFLKKVHATNIIGGIVNKEKIRDIDGPLMAAVEGYISQRERRDSGLGFASDLKFEASRPPTNRRKPQTKTAENE